MVWLSSGIQGLQKHTTPERPNQGKFFNYHFFFQSSKMFFLSSGIQESRVYATPECLNQEIHLIFFKVHNCSGDPETLYS